MSDNFPGVRVVLSNIHEEYAQGIAFLRLIKGMLVKEPKRRSGVNGLSDIIDGDFVSVWGLTKPRWCPRKPLKATKDDTPNPDWWREFQPGTTARRTSSVNATNNASSFKSESIFAPTEAKY
eukprot:gnl/Chilomastix_caulleri/2672.p1 GENE.gnl/Chilomastix_caulleri/2672~~gnl/Chilomastix_caulleri/2672.p1  ORF type:complete len:137 (+),score=47.77 gnl/Chilomastix_caulleri/2672:46-411(+)